MSTTTIAILCISALVVSIVVGSVKKVNIGILSLIFAYIIGCVLMGKPASTVTTLFPVKIMMYILTVAYFYGFAIMNGTMQALGDRIIYLFRNHAALLPWGIFLGAVIVGAAGGGGQMAVIVMAPIAFSLAKKANFHPLLAFMATVTGAPLGGTTFWSIGGVATKSIAESSGIDADVASRLVSQQSVTLAICQISFMLIMYFILKGHKVKNVVIDKPAPMEKNQKLTLGLIVGSVALIVLPSLINILFPNPVLRYLTSYVFEIQLLSLIGGMICTFLKLGDGRLVIKEMIPWNMILVICGVGTLIGVASNYGVVQMVAEWVGSQRIRPRSDGHHDRAGRHPELRQRRHGRVHAHLLSHDCQHRFLHRHRDRAYVPGLHNRHLGHCGSAPVQLRRHRTLPSSRGGSQQAVRPVLGGRAGVHSVGHPAGRDRRIQHLRINTVRDGYFVKSKHLDRNHAFLTMGRRGFRCGTRCRRAFAILHGGRVCGIAVGHPWNVTHRTAPLRAARLHRTRYVCRRFL